MQSQASKKSELRKNKWHAYGQFFANRPLMNERNWSSWKRFFGLIPLCNISEFFGVLFCDAFSVQVLMDQIADFFSQFYFYNEIKISNHTIQNQQKK